MRCAGMNLIQGTKQGRQRGNSLSWKTEQKSKAQLICWGALIPRLRKERLGKCSDYVACNWSSTGAEWEMGVSRQRVRKNRNLNVKPQKNCSNSKIIQLRWMEHVTKRGQLSNVITRRPEVWTHKVLLALGQEEAIGRSLQSNWKILETEEEIHCSQKSTFLFFF